MNKLKSINIFVILLIIHCSLLIVKAQWTPDAYINDFRVNDDATIQQQNYSKIGVDSAGNFVVVWNDRRNSSNNQNNQVFCQVFDKFGNRVGNNFRIGQDTTYAVDLAVLKDGRFIVYWINFFYVGLIFKYELYFQRFSNNGTPLTSIFKVVDSNYSYGAQTFQGGGIRIDSTGKFVICWCHRPTISSIYPNVFFQRFDSTGNRMGFVDSANEFYSRVLYPEIAVNNNGSFVITWQDNRLNISNNKYDIFMQRYNSNGIKIGNNIKVNDDTDTTKEQDLPWIDGDGKGGFVITWYDERNFFNEPHIYFQVYDSTGTPVGANKRADESNGTPAFSKVGVRGDSKFFIGWQDNWYAGRDQFYGRRFTKTGDTIGIIYMVPQSSPSSSGQSPSDIKILDDRIYVTWNDTRNGNPDIYCNVRSFQNPDSVIMGINPVINNNPHKFKFYLPYPNPFNPITKIKYQIPNNSYVKLSVYDITGREVMSLVNGEEQSGTYEIIFNGTKLSSGVYFIKIEAHDLKGQKFVDAKKMVLVR